MAIFGLKKKYNAKQVNLTRPLREILLALNKSFFDLHDTKGPFIFYEHGGAGGIKGGGGATKKN